MNISNAKKAIKAVFAAKCDLTPCLVGPNGIGKTEIVRQIVTEMGFDGIVEIRLGTMADQGDLTGIPTNFTSKDGKLICTFSLPEMLDKKGKYIYFLDEFNRARPELQQAIFQMIRERRIGTHDLPEGSRVIAAMNPATENFNVVDMQDDALNDRFAYIHLTPSVEEWLVEAKKRSLPIDITGFIERNPNMLDVARTEHFSYGIVKQSRRSYMDFSLLYAQNLEESLLQELGFGILGIEATQAFLADKKQFSISANDVLLNFKEHEKMLKDLVKNNRNDQLSSVLQAIMSKKVDLGGNEEDYTPIEVENMTKFMYLLPKDLLTANLESILYNDSLAKHFNDVESTIKLMQHLFPHWKANKKQLVKEHDEYTKAVAELFADFEKFKKENPEKFK